MQRARDTIRAGFTLIEIMVVLIILTLLMSITLPTFFRTEKRQFDLTVDELADLLTMFAQRDHTSQKSVGIFYDEPARVISLVELDQGAAEGVYEADWRLVPFVKPVKLPDSIGEGQILAFEDGQSVDFSEWPVLSRPGQSRPSIELQLNSGGHKARLRLQPYSMSPVVVDNRAINQYRAQQMQERQAIDLDAMGQTREDW